MHYLIRNAAVFDGLSPQPKKLTVGLENNKIRYVGDDLTDSAAECVIDATGLYLCPGFVDTHASTGFGYTFPQAGDHKLFQGVTSEIIGNCGTSPAPIADRLIPDMKQLSAKIGFAFTWRTLSDWFRLFEKHGLPLNMGTFVGHNTLRSGVCEKAVEITPQELAKMSDLLQQALLDGALGVSSGLVYAPGSFSDTAELIELAKVAARHGGCYVSHIRNEREALEDAVAEAIEIGRQAQVPVLISHLKAAEKPNWGKIPNVIAMIEAARREHVEVTCEVYPYTAVSTRLSTFLPKEAMNAGPRSLREKLRTTEWRQRCVEWLRFRKTNYSSMVLITESLPGMRGLSIQNVAEQLKQSPGDSIVDVLINDPEAWIVYHCISDQDMEEAILWPNSIICSDSWSYPVNAPNQIGDPHPRTFGAFTRFLERYALREERIPFGTAVSKISSRPADWLGITQRGRIAENHFADLVLLNPQNVEEKATFENPRQVSSGTEYLWVNGTLMIENGQLLERLPGHVLRNRSRAA